jgi:hypothetical protein
MDKINFLNKNILLEIIFLLAISSLLFFIFTLNYIQFWVLFLGLIIVFFIEKLFNIKDIKSTYKVLIYSLFAVVSSYFLEDFSLSVIF